MGLIWNNWDVPDIVQNAGELSFAQGTLSFHLGFESTTKTWNPREKRLRKVTLLHSWRQVKQNLCRHEFVMLLFSTFGVQVMEFKILLQTSASFTSPRQMGQVDSSGETGRPSRDLDFRFLLCQEYYSMLAQDFILAWLDHWRWTGVVCEALEVKPLA